MSAPAPIRIGVSSCLLGNEVRYDGGHKRSRFVTDALAQFVEWVPFCPELEAGLGVPRPAMRLVGENGSHRLLEITSGNDHTEALEHAAAQRCDALAELDLSGTILKKDSPSCGFQRVKVYSGDAMPARDGVGLFARRLIARFPNLPVEDEGRLNDAVLRENFIERVFAYRRVRDLFAGRWSNGDAVAFHTHHKLQLMAHSRVIYNELGRLVARVADVDRAEFAEHYEARFMEGMSIPATRGSNTNVLQHAAGHLKHLDPESRAELADLIHDYRLGLVPLVVPVTLLRHHTRTHDVTYLNGQTFLEPHPKELMLRNHV